MSHIPLLIGAAAAALACAISPGHAGYFGNAPWCAVVNTGAGNIEWDCEYASIEACRPNVIAGNRGFCQINPYFSPAPPHGGPHVKRAPAIGSSTKRLRGRA
jgi:hypothetical protein